MSTREDKDFFFLKISCDTWIVDLTCLSVGRKEINAFAVGIFTSLVCSLEKTCFNAIKQTRVDLESKTRRRKASQGKFRKLKIRTIYKSESAENWPERALYSNK